jgi:hypothetical protein
MTKTKVCALPECGKEHQRRGSRYCSADCVFWSRYDRSGGPDACWTWKGPSNKKNGYGSVEGDLNNGKRTSAHRHAYRLHYMVDPGELHVLHRCDVRLCGNPAHLFLGTNRDNWQDAINKWRRVITMPGEGNIGAKLTTKEVRAIRRSAAKVRDLVREYGVNRDTIWKIIRRKTWKHVPQETTTAAE